LSGLYLPALGDWFEAMSEDESFLLDSSGHRTEHSRQVCRLMSDNISAPLDIAIVPEY
jgi:hypothetical protein